MYRTIFHYTLIFFLMSIIVSCSGSTRQRLGLDQKAPNEFKVISNPPLSIPPDFSLRPPKKSHEKRATDNPSTLQRDILGIAPSSEKLTQQEYELLKNMGSNPQDATIRETLEKEQQLHTPHGWFGRNKETITIPKTEDEKGLLDKWLGL